MSGRVKFLRVLPTLRKNGCPFLGEVMTTFRTEIRRDSLNGKAKSDSAPLRVAREKYELLIKMLVAHRTKCGLTQQALADKLHQSRNFVSRYENGHRSLSVVEFVELAIAMDFDPAAMVRQVER